MKKSILFILICTMIIGSVALAAEGDIIHTGNKRVYRKGVDENQLVDDILKGAKVERFYRETADGKFVNIVQEENAEEATLLSIMSDKGLKNPTELKDYIKNNETEFRTEFESKLESLVTPLDFSDITDSDKGNIEDYFGSSKAPKLKEINYSTPVPGGDDNTTKITTKVLPSGGTSWIVKVGQGEFKDLEVNEVIEDPIPYTSGKDIEVDLDQHLLLAAIDNTGKLKAYASIEIVASMVNIPRVEVDIDSSITIDLSKGENYSGSTKVQITSDISKGTWKLALLDIVPGKIYTDSKFAGSLDYEENIELIVASDSELDNMNDSFKKYIIVYSEVDGKIEKYNVAEVKEANISGILKAPELIDGSYSTPIPGGSAGTSKIVTLNPPVDATKWMYALVKDGTIAPDRDRIYEGSNPYEAGKDIKVSAGDYLMILATDDGGKVRAYRIVEIKADMIKGLPADTFIQFEHYSVPERGEDTGTTKFQHLNYNGKELYYELSDKPIATPEKNSDFSEKIELLTEITPDSKNIADNIGIFLKDAPELKNENGFVKHMMIYAVDGNKNVLAYKDFVMTPNNVRLPNADKLPWQNYRESESGEPDPLKPGTTSNSTVLRKLDKNGITDAKDLKYVYTFVSEDNIVIGINEVVQSINPLSPGEDLTSAKIGDSLLILLVDNRNRTKYYATIKLTENNTRAGDAPRLFLGKNFTNPEPGSDFGSTRFNLLGFNDLEGATHFMVAASDKAFQAVELDSTVSEAVKYATVADDGKIEYTENKVEGKTKTDAEGNILGVDSRTNRYLLLLATDDEGKVKGYINLTLTENMIRGNRAKPLNSNNYTIDKGTVPGTIRFSKLAPFGVANTSWMYVWAEKDIFKDNPPFEGQVIADATTIRTRTIDANSSEGIDDIKVEKQTDNHGYILLLATNGNRVAGYTVITVKDTLVQSTADELDIDLEPGKNPDSTKIIGTDENLANKYIISTTPMEKPGPNADLPRTGVKDVPASKEIAVKVGEYLRIFNVDTNNKIKKFIDVKIKLGGLDNPGHIKQGSATLSILNPDDASEPLEILEGRVKANAIKIVVKLTGAQWADVVNDKTIKDALLNGFKADGTEQGEWSKVIQKIKDGRFSISKTQETLTITTTATEDYNISEEQKISLTIPARAIVGAINPIEVPNKIVIKPTIDAKISGSVVNNIRQSEINSGNATILIDIVDSKWIDNIETSENKQLLLGGFKGDGGNNSPWNKELDGLKSKIGIEDVKLIDPQKISITIPKNELKFNSPETITLTIDNTLVDGAKDHIIAAPSFTIYPDILPLSGNVDDSKEVILEAPNYLNALEGNDTWIVNLDGNTSFKEDFSVTKDISTSTLASGLKLEITKVTNKQLSIKLVGKARNELSDGAINLVIKSSAINEKNYSDSETIPLEYRQGGSIDLDDVTYEIKDGGIYLNIGTGINKADILYSINSTTSSNGDWATIPADNKISENLKPITISVKEAKQADNFKIVGKLVNDPAPTGIAIVDYDYSGDELVVTLNESKDLQYNLTTPNKWENVPTDGKIPLTKDSSLIVREKALPGVGGDGSLPSLATAKLNGLYLGDVKLDVSQSKIIGATRDMRYRLSNDGSWNNITTNDPTVNFKEANQVWISDAKNDINKNPLGKVNQAPFTPDEKKVVETLLDNETGDGIYYHIGDRKIVNKTGINLQYNITKGAVPTGSWFNLEDNIPVNNVNFLPGSVFVRKVIDGNSLPSNPVKIFEIAEAINPPKIEVSLDSKTLLYEGKDEDGNVAYKDLNDEFEYRINNGDYQNGGLLKTDPSRFGNVTVYVKRKATRELLASKEVSFKFTENISLANVRVNVADGTIEGTTTKMEYRTDKNSPWKGASSSKTTINMYKGMNIWIRELDKPSTSTPILEDLGKMPEPTKDKLEYNVVQKYITNNFTNILEYRINDNPWNTINVGQTISMEFVPTRLSIRTKATFDKLASDVVDVIESLAYPEEAPEVVGDDDNNKVIFNPPADTSWKDYEFKLKTDTEWMPGTILKDYIFDGDKIVHIRKKGTTTELPSEIAEVIFTKNIDVDKVELREGTPLRLIKTEPEMEYQVYLKDESIPTTWIKASAGTTNLDSKLKKEDIVLIVVRDSRDMSLGVNKYKIFKNTNNNFVIGDESDLPVDLSKISYEITANGIEFTGITDRMKYKSSSSDDWTNGNNDTVTVDSLDVMEITIQDSLYPSVTRTITVSERADTPEVTVSKVDYEGDKMTLTLKDFDKETMEYSINNGVWVSTDPLTVEVSNDDKLVVRSKAIIGLQGLGKLPSEPTTNLNPTSLIGVSVSMDGPKLVGTTKFMEYSLNSTDGKDGTWNPARDIETPMNLSLETIIWIRETLNNGNARKIGPIGQAKMPDLSTKVYRNIAKGKIANFTDQVLEFRVAGSNWTSIDEDLGDGSKVALNIVFKPGPLEFRTAANGSNFASKPLTFEVIKAAASKPVVIFDDIGDKIVSIDGKSDNAGNQLENYEYRIMIDDQVGEWTTVTFLLTNVSGKQEIEIRKRATSTELASQINKILFTDNVIKRVRLSDNVSPLELNGTTSQMQYRINDGGWQICKPDLYGNSVILRNDKETPLDNLDDVNKIEIRLISEPGSIFIVYSK